MKTCNMRVWNTTSTYGSVAKFFHWLIFLLLLCMVTLGYFLSSIPDDYKGVAYNTHKLTGLVVFMLMLLRAAWALANPKPTLPASTKTWERWAERSVHWSLYAVVIAMPMLGLIGSSAANKPPHVGDFKLMLPVQQSKALADGSFSIHNTLAIVLIVLVGIHVSAALYHYFIRKDKVLQRMLPSCNN